MVGMVWHASLASHLFFFIGRQIEGRGGREGEGEVGPGLAAVLLPVLIVVCFPFMQALLLDPDPGLGSPWVGMLAS